MISKQSLYNINWNRSTYSARKQANLTQKQLARLMNVDESVIMDLEEADYEDNALLMLQKIAIALNQRLKIDLISQAS